MATITVSEEKFNRVLSYVETLIEDVASIFDQDEIAKRRLHEIKLNPSTGKSEKELDTYLKKRSKNLMIGRLRNTKIFLKI